MIGLVLLMASAATATPALWENVAQGMPAAEVQALYPAGEKVSHRPDRIVIEDRRMSESCKADVQILLDDGAVDHVELRGQPALLGKCGGEVFELLSARYGEPDSKKGKGYTPFTRSRTTSVWNRDGLELRLVRYTSPGYAGSGLTRPSWILTYASATAPSSAD